MVVLMVGDGACLFRSISFNLLNTHERCKEIRNTVVPYVTDSWDYFKTVSDGIQYINRGSECEIIGKTGQQFVAVEKGRGCKAVGRACGREWGRSEPDWC